MAYPPRNDFYRSGPSILDDGDARYDEMRANEGQPVIHTDGDLKEVAPLCTMLADDNLSTAEIAHRLWGCRS